MKRSYEENILLALCVVGALGISPFSVYRFIQGEWFAGIVDVLIVVTVVIIGLYVWHTRKVRIPSIVLTLSYMAVMVAVNYISGTSLIFWAYPTMAAAYFLVKPPEGLAINVIALFALLPALWIEMTSFELSVLLITLILNNVFAYIFARVSIDYQKSLAQMAKIDPLTGVGNRSLFVENVRNAIAAKQRYGSPMCMIMMDIDHFKRINDEFGHISGDNVLVGLMSICQKRIRGVDSIYRLGGEEFAILAIGIDFDGAMYLAEDIRKQVYDTSLLDKKTVTISLGLAECMNNDTIVSLMERADAALYRAKNNGRNQVCS